ncbi:hypothetical protein BRYFOR_05126 [Marvinbryantia formatexigens DSM 14469]|uniref:Uncharacterized protein n=1 Tax=Marvinbryantia formatexigens DSM 14469 TaxID=478749 RepID=C6L935_9FIRM|nr:hypothetical protein BRYFOR_05126 [Marvinbryantia formatexigens DSM 14469]
MIWKRAFHRLLLQYNTFHFILQVLFYILYFKASYYINNQIKQRDARAQCCSSDSDTRSDLKASQRSHTILSSYRDTAGHKINKS